MSLPSRRQVLISLATGAAGLLGVKSAGRLAGHRLAIPEGTAYCAEPTIARLAIETGQARAFGTKTSVTVLHADREVARRAVAAALAEMELVDRLMSLYRPESQLCQLNSHGILQKPHPYLVAVLRHAEVVSRQSEGAFDITVQPLWNVYVDAKQAAREPEDSAIREATSKIGWRRVAVTPHAIRLQAPGTAVTLNGIAQGFAGDRAMEVLRRHGIEHALVDSGEIGTLGGKEGGEPWTVGIQHPRRKDAYAELAGLDGRSLATSGDYATAFDDDCREHHIFNPHTGRSPTIFSSVSIAARTATQADALTKVVFVLGVERGLKLIEATAGADAFFILKDGRTLATQGFPLVSPSGSELATGTQG